MDGRGIDVGIDAVVELPQRLLAGEVSHPDTAFGPAPVTVLALGHQQLGEEPGTGQDPAFGPGDHVGGLGSQGGQPQPQPQPQQPAGSIDRRV